MANYQRLYPRGTFLSTSPVQTQNRRASTQRELPFAVQHSNTHHSPQPESSPRPRVLWEPLPFWDYSTLPQSSPPPLSRAVQPFIPYSQVQAVMEDTRHRLWDASGDAANAATDFIQNHTALDHSVPLLEECPICLDPYETENCLRITGIPGCEHYVGQKCLEEILRTRPLEEKKCPLCRAVWIPASATPQRHSTPTYHNIIGLDLDMRDNAPFVDFTAPPAPRPNISSAQGNQNRLDPRPHPSREVILIDSDSEEDDYQTQVQNFEAFNRDIADIRNRARNTQLSGRRRHQRSTSGTANLGRNSGNGSEITGGRVNARPGGFNRFLNRSLNRNLNPFKPLANAPLLSSDSGVRRRPSPHTRRERRSPLQEVRPPPISLGSSHTISPTREVRRQRDSTQVPDARPGIAMEIPPNVEVVEAPTIQSRASRETVRSLQLEQREQELNLREAALANREADMARWEDALVGRAVRTDALMEMLRRHLDERKQLERRQSGGLNGLMHE